MNNRQERGRGHERFWTGPEARTGIYGSEGHKGSVWQLFRYALNANRVLARETWGSSVADPAAKPAANPAGNAAGGAEAAGAMGVRVRTSRARRRADVMTPGGAAAPAP